jgi:hypothetical protein
MKRIAICSEDNKASDTAHWLMGKLRPITKNTLIIDHKNSNTSKPLTSILNMFIAETSSEPDISIHVGTRYDIDRCTIDKHQNIMRLINLVEKLSKASGKSLRYDMVFIVNSEEATILAEEYKNIYNLNTKILPNRPAPILGKMIMKIMKFAPNKEAKK